MLTKIQNKTEQSYKTLFDGKPIWNWINDIIDAINGQNSGNVYNVASIATRDAISSPEAGSIAFIADGDGNGNSGISGFNGTSWNTPFIVAGVGGLDTKLQSLALAGTVLTATLSNNATVQVDLATLPDLDEDNELQTFALNTATGAWSLSDNGGSGDLGAGIDLTGNTLTIFGETIDLSTYVDDQNLSLTDYDLTIADGNTVALDTLVNNIYDVTTIAARNAIVNPTKGSIAFIADSDGNGNPGLSGYNGVSWNAPLVLVAGGGGSGGRLYDTLTSGDLSVRVAREGGAVSTLTVNAVGDYTVVVGSGADALSLEISGNNGTVTGSGDFIIRIDNSANGINKRFSSQIYNAGNGAFVDAHAQGNNHTRTFAGNVLTHTYPNMQPYGAAGFEIELR